MTQDTRAEIADYLRANAGDPILAPDLPARVDTALAEIDRLRALLLEMADWMPPWAQRRFRPRIAMQAEAARVGEPHSRTERGLRQVQTQHSKSCRKCGGAMRPGTALRNTLAGIPDFPGGDVCTVSETGPAIMIPCMKCEACGWSVTTDAAWAGSIGEPSQD